MDKNKSKGFHYNKEIKQNKNFMYSDLRRSHCYGTDFTGSNFNFSSFRGAHFKGCNFFSCTFRGAEFIGTNLKKSKFRRAVFENAVFEGVNLGDVDFRDAEFKNVIFVGCDLSSAKSLEYKESEVRVFDEIPELDISKGLEEAVLKAMGNEKVKSSRVLDTKDGGINPISIMILLEKFSEKNLISGLNILSDRLDRDFCTLSYITKCIETYGKEGIL